MDSVTAAINSVSADWATAVWRASWQGALALAAVWAVCRAWPRVPPSVRSWLWRLAFLRLVIGLVWTRTVSLPLLPGHSWSSTSVTASQAGSLVVPMVGAFRPSGPTADPQAVLPSLATVLLAVWVLGVVAYCISAARGLLQARALRLSCRWRPTDGLADHLADLCRYSGVRRLPELMIADIPSPLLTGVWKPWVVLPGLVVQSSDFTEKRLMLAHEVGHLKRRDLWWNWLLLAARVLFFFHPLVWLGCREWLLAQEVASDELALQMTEASEHEYGEMLVRVAARPAAARPGIFIAGITESYRALARRLTAMASRAPVTRRRLMVSGLLMLALTGGVFMPWRLVAREPRLLGRDTAAAAPVEAPNPWARLGQLAGRIITPRGSPVAEATVTLIGRDPDEGLGVVVASTTSDAGGRFAFGEPGRLLARYPVAPAMVVQAPGWAVSVHTIVYPEEGVEITAAPATELQIAFADATGGPAAGIRVRVDALLFAGAPRAYLSLPSELRTQFASETDAQGLCRIGALPQGATASLSVEDERFAQLGAERQVTLGESAVTVAKPVALARGASIGGTLIYGPTGKPAAGIRVGAQAVGDGMGWGSTMTDSSGRYSLKQLSAGEYNIALDLRGEAGRSWTTVAHAGVKIAAGEQLEGMDFSLISGAVIAGRVTASRTRMPIPKVLVGVYGPAHPLSSAWVQNMWTGVDGSYALRVPAGKQHLYLQGSWPAGFSGPKQPAHDFEIKDGETRTVSFELPGSPMRPIHGRVVGPKGNPIAGAEVIILPYQRVIRADARGEFNLGPVPVILRARRGSLATPQSLENATGGEVVLRLRDHVFGSVSGLITDARGGPVGGAQVNLGLLQPAPNEPGTRPSYPVSTTTADAAGRFTITSLWPNQRYSITVHQPGPQGHGASATFELRPGETQVLPALRATLSARGGPA